jgi:hypothetical protein
MMQQPWRKTRVSAKAQTETLGRVRDWSAHPLRADVREVRLVPIPDLVNVAHTARAQLPKTGLA